jgi:hypothetical protein
MDDSVFAYGGMRFPYLEIYRDGRGMPEPSNAGNVSNTRLFTQGAV